MSDKVAEWRHLAEGAMMEPGHRTMNALGEALDDACDELRSLQAKIDVLTVELNDAKLDTEAALDMQVVPAPSASSVIVLSSEPIPPTSPVFEPENSLDEPPWMRL